MGAPVTLWSPSPFKTSLHSHCAKLHISPTIYWLSTDRNYTIGHQIGDFKVDQNNNFCKSALHDRLCIEFMLMVWFCLQIVFSLWLIMVSRPKLCIEINFAGLTLMKCPKVYSRGYTHIEGYYGIMVLQISDFFIMIIILVYRQSINSQRNVWLCRVTM